jgi:hypothetical protein
MEEKIQEEAKTINNKVCSLKYKINQNFFIGRKNSTKIY